MNQWIMILDFIAFSHSSNIAANNSDDKDISIKSIMCIYSQKDKVEHFAYFFDILTPEDQWTAGKKENHKYTMK